MSQGCALLIWGQKAKGQGHNALIPENCFSGLLLYLYTYNDEISHTDPHELRIICPIDFGVKMSKVKVTMSGLLNMV